MISKKLKRTSGRNHIRFFTNSHRQCYWGAIFVFSAKIGFKSAENGVFCILFRSMGGYSPPRPLATLLVPGSYERTIALLLYKKKSTFFFTKRVNFASLALRKPNSFTIAWHWLRERIKIVLSRYVVNGLSRRSQTAVIFKLNKPSYCFFFIKLVEIIVQIELYKLVLKVYFTDRKSLFHQKFLSTF